MAQNLVIIGNSGAARECYWLFQEIYANDSTIQFKGFLGFEGYQPNLKDLTHYDLGSDNSYRPHQEDIFVIGIGDPALRSQAYRNWENRGVEFLNLIHPSVYITGSSIGKANIIARGSYISCNSSLGDANFLNGSVVIGHDCQIGDSNFFGPFSLILGNVSIGCSNRVGARAVVLAGAKVGNNNTLVPGAYLYKGCRNNQIMAGNPALSID